VSGHSRSKRSVKDYCAEHGVSVASYYQWRRRLRAEPDTNLFSPVEIADETPGFIEVELPGGVLLRFGALPPVWYLRQLSSQFGGF
jgi:hypothetical protein